MNEAPSIASSLNATTLTKVLAILQPLAVAHATAETVGLDDRSPLRKQFADDHLETLLRVVEEKVERGHKKVSPEDAARRVLTTPRYQPA